MTNKEIYIGSRINLVCFGPAYIFAIEPDNENGEMVVHARSEMGDSLTLSLAYAARVIA